jgi:dinuclear metal center YbgI/SA1388 family protein
MKISDIINYIEELAPLSYQESYDNSGLLVGQAEQNFRKGLVCFDLNEKSMQEAIDSGVNLILTHHPFLFHNLKSITGETLSEKLLIQAIKHDIAIYAMHTNLDNVFHGVNYCFAEKLLLKELKILRPVPNRLKKIITYVPTLHADQVRNALFEAGGGHIGNYDSCSFNVSGTGSFKANQQANPFVGEKNKIHFENEIRIETIFPDYKEKQLIQALYQAHPYEEPAYDIYRLENENHSVGSGMIGKLTNPMTEFEFLSYIKSQMNLSLIMHSKPQNKSIQRIALCGGSGAFLIKDAIKQKADVFVTGEIRYHDFIDFGKDIFLLSIGHYESEYAIKHYLCKKLIKKFSTFAVSKTEINPVNYFY